jgi:Tol biopolymer transport system component
MKTAVVVVAVVLLATLSAVSARQSSPQVLFEKALALEEVQGKVAEAIAVYEKVVSETSDKALAAQAQLHIGLCYERMGLEKARQAYEKVIKNYPGQAAAVAVAREKLDNILRAAAVAKKGTGELTVRNIPIPPTPPLELYGVSPDGKYVAYVEGNTGDLGVRELSTGNLRRLTDEGKGYSQYAIYPRWSPDSTRLTYAWNESQLRVVALDGSPPRILVGDNKEEWVSPADWSPDGKQILLGGFSKKQRTLRLSLVDAADGSLKPLRTFANRNLSPGQCFFSPDGRAIAYSRANQDGVRERDVFLLSLDGSRESPLIQHPADDVLLAWLPGGAGILFASDRGGTFDLWMVAVDKGQVQLAPTLVKRGVGPITPMGLTRTGAFYYQTPTARSDVYTASLDSRTGRVVGSPKKEPLPFEGQNMMPDWSPDGRQLVYGSMRPGEKLGGVLCIYSVDTGKVREYRLDKAYGYPRWAPNGRHLLLQATVADGQGIHRMDVQSGEVTPLMAAGDGEYLHDFRVSPDGKWVVFGRDIKANCQIVRRDAESGREQEIDRTPSGNNTLALSRDGSRLAMILRTDAKTRVLKVMEFPDGTPKEITRFALGGSFIIDLAWSPDGRFIYYSDNPTGKAGDWHLRLVPAEGGPVQDLGVVMGYYRQISAHPDGSRITFATAPPTPEPAQVWVLENFLPATKR